MPASLAGRVPEESEWARAKAEELTDEFVCGSLLSLLLTGGKPVLDAVTGEDAEREVLDYLALLGVDKDAARPYVPELVRTVEAAREATEKINRAGENADAGEAWNGLPSIEDLAAEEAGVGDAYAAKQFGVDKSSDGGIINSEGERSRRTPGDDKRSIVSDIVGKTEYNKRMELLGENRDVVNIITFQARKTLWRRNGTDFEDLVFVDPTTGKVLAQRNQDTSRRVMATDSMKNMVNTFPHGIIAIHNHPYNMLPSYSDLVNAKRYKYGIIVCHNGTVIKYTVDSDANIEAADNMLNYIQRRFDMNEDLTIELALLAELGVHLEVFC